MRQMSRPVWRQLYRQACATGTFQRHCSHAPTLSSALRPPVVAAFSRSAHRLYSSETAAPSKPLTDRVDDDAAQRKKEIEERKAAQPSYYLGFTCAKCMTKSGHRISKQGYHHGTVLVNCPGCSNKHLISDHLGIFSDRGVTLEDIMREKGQLLTKGVLGADGDVEFLPEDKHKSSEREQKDEGNS